MTLAPMDSGTAGMLQFPDPVAMPVWPLLLLQLTREVPAPPEVVPEIEIEESLVEDPAAGLVLWAGLRMDRTSGVTLTGGADASRDP